MKPQGAYQASYQMRIKEKKEKEKQLKEKDKKMKQLLNKKHQMLKMMEAEGDDEFDDANQEHQKENQVPNIITLLFDFVLKMLFILKL